jgi:hypothetical protein
VPGWLPAAMTWLTSALDGHWNGEYYRSVLPVPTDYRAPYDPNIAIYGAESVTDPRLLATASRLRTQWADPGSRCENPFIPNGSGRLPIRSLPRPGRDHRDDDFAARRGRRAARGRGQDAAGHRVPQRPLRAQRAVRRGHGLREVGVQPVVSYAAFLSAVRACG